MSDQNNETVTDIDLETVSPELRTVIEYDEVPEQMLGMVVSIHEASEETVREAWDQMPASAQNILDNFEQFHALISVSQAFAGVNFMQEAQNLNMSQEMTDEQQEAYRAQLLDQVLYNCVKDMTKQVKKARRDPILKRDFQNVFKK
ncbi:DUF3069 domain-containing protein [Vibrio albus]|jgi:hypothetical protein|uniref:DUF3069 domain-containing protein n=1 Tax=Vibrio albus TaxID=2200953 RepID=A0A2U3B608_9VIBR|nr:DUF3069 domain-containing protein [Vibrio albus]PWI32236.1 DUF3069 domain-containing protein [Vibrio albus]